MIQIKKYTDSFVKYIKNYPVIFALTILLFALNCISIFSNSSSFGTSFSYVFGFTYSFGGYDLLLNGTYIAMLLSTLCALFGKIYPSFKKWYIQLIASCIGFAICLLATYFYNTKLLATNGIIGIILCLVLFAYIKINENLGFAIKNYIFSFSLSGVLLLGLLTTYWAFDNLIYKSSFRSEIYMLVLAFAITIFFFNIFISLILEDNKNGSVGKVFKIFDLYVLFPIYAILLSILYLYLIKSVVTLDLPQGEINLFVSIATSCYIFFYYTLKEFKHLQFIKFFYKYGHYILFPLVILQSIAFFIRVGAYGFTFTRVLSLCFIILSAIFFVLAAINNEKYTIFFFPICAAFVFVLTLTPFSAHEISYRNQFSRVTSILNKYGILKDGELQTFDKALYDANFSSEDKEMLASSLTYLRNIDKTYVRNFSPIIDDEKLDFATEKTNFNSNRNYVYHLSYKKSIDIAEYKNMELCSSSNYKDTNIIQLQTSKTTIDITDFLLSLKNETNESGESSDLLIYKVSEDMLIVFKHVSFTYDTSNNMFTYYNVDAFILTNDN